MGMCITIYSLGTNIGPLVTGTNLPVCFVTAKSSDEFMA